MMKSDYLCFIYFFFFVKFSKYAARHQIMAFGWYWSMVEIQIGQVNTPFYSFFDKSSK